MSKRLSDIVFEETLEIDCFQNIIIALSKFNGYTNFIPGAVWPWKYTILQENEHPEIENGDIVSLDFLKTLYSISYNYVRIEKNEKNISFLINLIDNSGDYIILGVDQFYIPYQAPTIYMKKHGKHTMIIERGIVGHKIKCISTIPKFNGYIDIHMLVEAFMSPYVDCWFVKMSFPVFYNPPQKESLINYFMQSFQNRVVYDEFGREKREIGTDELYNLYKNLNQHGEIGYFCKNEWGWKMSRRSQILVTFLTYMTEDTEFIRNVSGFGQEIDTKWKILFRKIFVASKSTMNHHFDKINSLFEEIICIENACKHYIETKKETFLY